MNNEKVTKFYNDYFTLEKRKKNEEAPEQIVVSDIIKELVTGFKRLDGSFFANENPTEKNNMNTLIELTEIPIETKSIDNAFAKYLVQFSTSTNLEYFKTMARFILMSRDYLLRNKVDIYNEGASGFPDQCNDFVSEYLEKKKEFGLELADTIDLVQHFCYWLHEKEYTKSVLTLLTYE